MTGHVRSRFLTSPPVITPVRPQKLSSKSLCCNHVPITYLFPILCSRNRCYLQQNRIDAISNKTESMLSPTKPNRCYLQQNKAGARLAGGYLWPTLVRVLCGQGGSDFKRSSRLSSSPCCHGRLYLDYSIDPSGVVAITAPLPVLGLLDKASPDWIAVDVFQLLDTLL